VDKYVTGFERILQTIMKHQTEGGKKILVITTMAQAGLINVNVLMRLYIFFNLLIFNMSKFDVQNPIKMAKVQEKCKAVHSIPQS